MKKLIRDTLQNPKTGQWSRKNITSASSFAALVLYVFGMPFFGHEVHDFVAATFATLTGSLLGISSWEKFNLNQKQNVEH
jgi:hypothetical protein